MTPWQVDVIRQFRALEVRYLLVGGQAMRARGIDRPTRDLDLWIGRDLVNAEAMMSYLQAAQNRPSLDRLQTPDLKLTVGDPARPEVDILTSVAGNPDFSDCLARSQQLRLDGHRLQVISTLDLLAAKEATTAVMDRDAMNPSLSDQDRGSATDFH